jgi:EAL domain-containing protein (putative c-di-GMP-specific phosphodiesterase class I)
MKTASLDDILRDKQLQAVFQPIVATRSLDIVGYEGLIRGPAGSALESPAALFAAARAGGRRFELEQACLRAVWSRFKALGLAGRLFANTSAGILLAPWEQRRALVAELAGLGIDGGRVAIEITEDQAISDYPRLRRIARRLGRHGFTLAIDDLGAGFASLRLWLELRPAYVKIDMVFIRDVERDPVKRAFLLAIRDIARACGTLLIAEGIETEAELGAVRELGIDYAQGYYLARPAASPPRTLDGAVVPASALRPFRHPDSPCGTNYPRAMRAA